MSLASPVPCFNLVRTDNVRSSEGLSRYQTGVAHVDYACDEIRLVDPRGEPCAIPTPGLQSRDFRHEYTDGTEGITKRLLAHEISFAVDYLDSATRRRLERWQHDRARVKLSPGFGRRSVFAWRPRELASASFTDLTGRVPITALHDLNSAWAWDDLMGGPGVMRFFNSAYAKVVKTPSGAGQVFASNAQNRFYTGSPPGSYPIGSSAADSGWDSWGTWAADIVRGFDASAFGVTDCPGALVVTDGTRRTGNGTDERVLARLLPTAVTGIGTVWIGVFLRGRGGSGLRLRLEHTNGLVKSVDLSTTDLGDWKLCWIGAYSTNWPGVAANQYVKIDVTPALGVTDDFDLQVGPSVCLWRTGDTLGAGHPQWLLNTRTVSDALQASFKMPQAGTVFASLYVPTWYSETFGRDWYASILKDIASNAFRMYVQNASTYAANTQRPVIFWGPGGAETTYAQVLNLLRPGRVTTIAAVWDHKQLVLYANGVAVATHAGAPQPPASAVTWSLFGVSDYQFWPLVPLGLRIDSEPWSADRVADEHATAGDPGTTEIMAAARGRIYEITAIPSTVRSGERETQWLGTLGLRQVDYVSADADVTSKEG